VQNSDPRGPTNQIQLGRVVQGAEKSTQFPSAIEDSLEPPLKVKWAKLRCLQKVDPLLERLTGIRNGIDRLRRHLEVINRWTARPENQAEASDAVWRQLERDVRNQLREQEDLFWELNVPNVEERTRLRILEGLAYQQQAEARAQDYSDLLTDERFPRIRGLGRPQKRAEPEPSSSVPKRGPILTRLGELNSETLTLKEVSSTGGSTQDPPKEVPQDQGKGKQPQVSGSHRGTRDHQIPPDTHVRAGNRSKRARTTV
jgi:hypothetical protein